MKLLIVLSVYLVLTKAQNKLELRRSRRTTTVAPDNLDGFYDERNCDTMVGSNADPWACLCRQFKFERATCEQDIQQFLPSQDGSQVCADQRHYYIGVNNQCHSDHAMESSNDPAGKAMQFALDLFQAADHKNPAENFIISPLSPQVLLAQLIAGSSAKARGELKKVLKLNGNEAASLVDALQAAANKDSTSNKLDIASVFFRAKGLTVKTAYRDAVKQNKIRMKEVDFSNAHLAANEVNDWANTTTRGNIPQVITEQGISSDMMMLLVNAIYFKGTWLYRFNETETNKRATFETSKNNKMPVQMMSQTNKLSFGEINYGMYSDSEQGLRWVELPYDGDELSMIVLLPKTQFKLDEMLRQTNGSHFQEIFKVIRRKHNPIKIHLKMPRFTIKSSVSLVAPLKKLGIKEIFEDDNPLPELFKSPAKVGDVKQDAFLSVDENGTTATAVSRVTIIPLSLNYNDELHFNCNEPFMVMVVDKTREIPLFMAKIRKPLKATGDQGRVQG